MRQRASETTPLAPTVAGTDMIGDLESSPGLYGAI